MHCGDDAPQRNDEHLPLSPQHPKFDHHHRGKMMTHRKITTNNFVPNNLATVLSLRSGNTISFALFHPLTVSPKSQRSDSSVTRSWLLHLLFRIVYIYSRSIVASLPSQKVGMLQNTRQLPVSSLPLVVPTASSSAPSTYIHTPDSHIPLSLYRVNNLSQGSSVPHLMHYFSQLRVVFIAGDITLCQSQWIYGQG